MLASIFQSKGGVLWQYPQVLQNARRAQFNGNKIEKQRILKSQGLRLSTKEVQNRAAAHALLRDRPEYAVLPDAMRELLEDEADDLNVKRWKKQTGEVHLLSQFFHFCRIVICVDLSNGQAI